MLRILVTVFELTSPAWLEDLRQAMCDDPCIEPDYAALAARAGISPSTLRRRFRQATGLTPHRYLIAQRCAAARRLLQETDWPLHRIAEELAYRDVYFFSRQFHQVTGLTPGRFRERRSG